ncbi:hypothetical protein ABZX72_34530 [Streptomyces cyaneofuscatus]|uniref:hypothetical protein n=1 Tax=Streptomyces cyaneofuscatus TaxID=66883 RepID=UPI0033B8676A
MSVGGTGIPRLNELTYVETAALAVEAGKTFEEIRLAIVDRAARHAQENDSIGAYEAGKWERLRANKQKYVNNTVDVLKELMRLGWMERHVLPSTKRSAWAHSDATFTLTSDGREWTALMNRRPLDGLNALAGALIETHPQFEGFLRVVGARPDSMSSHFTIPLMRPEASARRDDAGYLADFVAHTVERVHEEDLGWSAPSEAIRHALHTYVERAVRRAETRPPKESGKPTAPTSGLSRKRLSALCEEAAVRLAFTAAGCPMDYISHELLRRWTRFLGLANFSYYAPGPPALRLWATAEVTGRGASTEFARRVGARERTATMEALPRIWYAEDGPAAQEIYRPVWRIRAATCWERRISDTEFDAALTAAVRGEMPRLGFQIHLDEASHVRAPASTKPLVLPTRPGRPRIYHVMRVYDVDPREGVATP